MTQQVKIKRLEPGRYAVLINGRSTNLVIEKGLPPKYRQPQEWCIAKIIDGKWWPLTCDQKSLTDAVATIKSILCSFTLGS